VNDLIRRFRRRINEYRNLDVRADVEVRIESTFLGTPYGGWPVAVRQTPANPVVFSVGLGCDISFDLAVIARHQATVYGFDPTPKSRKFVESQSLPASFHFVPIGLASFDGDLTLHLPFNDWDSYSSDIPADRGVETVVCPVQRLCTIQERLGVSRIDILKIDIEGGEYTSVPDILATPQPDGRPIGQLLIELHYDTSTAQLDRARDLLRQIRSAGYRQFARSAVGKEFAFIHGTLLPA
jgi:FkbM family methyltransferase